jgi:phosphoglycerate dehydrogenase-like enzyme
MRIVMLESLGVSSEVIQQLAAPLLEGGHEFVSYDRVDDVEVLKSRAAGADVLMLANMPLPGEVIKSAENLRLISVAFTGIDHIDSKVCKDKAVTICNAAGYSTHSVAELTYGLLISVLRKIVPSDAATRASGTKAGLKQTELFGKTVGIVGTGAIGLRVAEIAKAFGCKVLAYSRTKKEEVSNSGITYVSLEELLSQSDVVSLHVPLTEATKGLINRDRLALMKQTAVLINTARGPVVDNSALAEALKEGKLAGAGIDVYEIEPPLPAGHPLFDAPNTVLAPHIAFATEEAILRRAEITFNNIYKWMEGNTQNVVL